MPNWHEYCTVPLHLSESVLRVVCFGWFRSVLLGLFQGRKSPVRVVEKGVKAIVHGTGYVCPRRGLIS